jgi:hypothetical protein
MPKVIYIHIYYTRPIHIPFFVYTVEEMLHIDDLIQIGGHCPLGGGRGAFRDLARCAEGSRGDLVRRGRASRGHLVQWEEACFRTTVPRPGQLKAHACRRQQARRK